MPPRYANKSSQNSSLINGRRPCVEKMKCNRMFPDVCGMFLPPLRGSIFFPANPRLTPWAALFRRFAAASMRQRSRSRNPALILAPLHRKSCDEHHTCRWNSRKEPSRPPPLTTSSEGAKECSPRRKPWVEKKNPHQPRRGEISLGRAILKFVATARLPDLSFRHASEANQEEPAVRRKAIPPIVIGGRCLAPTETKNTLSS